MTAFLEAVPPVLRLLAGLILAAGLICLIAAVGRDMTRRTR